ncbi:MAG: DUF47 family protein [Verrucomicrobia bacterium]|nr:DUF47 family protein [Verrucomicrobiota bacterium]
MISFQRILGHEDEFCRLLEISAREGCEAVAALKRLFDLPPGSRTLYEFAASRSKEKRVTDEISEKLITTFVTPMEREDLEHLARALYKIPKTVEKFAERYLVTCAQLQDVDFGPQLKLMEASVDLVLRMVQALGSGRDLEGIREFQSQLQKLESDADDLLLEMMRPFYQPGFPPLKAVILRDLYSLNEKVVDRCRDAGNVISHVIFKNA